MRPSAAGPGLRWGALLSLIGALLAVVGVFLAWASLTSIGTVVAAVETTTGVAGIRHWTGLLALLASGTAVLGAVGAGFFEDSPGRRWAALVATAAGLVALLAAVLGLVQREAIATTGLPGGTEALEFARDFAAEFNEELGLDIPAPRVETGTGVYATLIGGAVASAGGLISLRQEAYHRRGLHFGR
jgi:MFS family permease